MITIRPVAALVLLLAAAVAHAATPSVSAGNTHSLALHADGTVRAWGDDSAGALGLDRSLASSTPMIVNGLTGVVAVAAGDAHTLALKSDGTVWAWGDNVAGQLGDGTTTDRSTPVRVGAATGFAAVVAVDAGTAHGLARKADGTVWAWGKNGLGQLGDGTRTTRLAPVAVGADSPVTGVAALAAGGDHALAVKGDGTVWAWGANADGQVGDG